LPLGTPPRTGGNRAQDLHLLHGPRGAYMQFMSYVAYHPPKSTELKQSETAASVNIDLMALRDGMCRWPTLRSESGEQLFCGADCATLPNVYCGEHAARARAKPR
jgi:hypothetical protein